MRVLKWTIPVDDEFHPIGGGKVVHVDSQFGRREEVQVWTEESEDRGISNPRAALVIGTGHAIPPNTEHIGSVIPLSAGGHLVWHVYAAVQS